MLVKVVSGGCSYLHVPNEKEDYHMKMRTLMVTFAKAITA